jgi:hypothetical protein
MISFTRLSYIYFKEKLFFIILFRFLIIQLWTQISEKIPKKENDAIFEAIFGHGHHEASIKKM